jgi:hypothetical protein
MRENPHFREVTDNWSGPHPLQFRLFGLTTPEGFDPFLTNQYKERIERWVPFRTNRMFCTDVLNDEMLQALGIRYVFVRDKDEHDPILAKSRRFRLIGRRDIFGHVYEYLYAKPPYHWEHGEGSVEVLTWTPERRRFLVDSEQGGNFVLVEQFYPGWRARVDGHSVEVERWDGAFQSIRVPAGRRSVTFEFRPMSLFFGVGISLLALGTLLLVIRREGTLQTLRKSEKTSE